MFLLFKQCNFSVFINRSLQFALRYKGNILYNFSLVSNDHRYGIYLARAEFTQPLLLIRIFSEYNFYLHNILSIQMGICPVFGGKSSEQPKAPTNDLKSTQRPTINIPKANTQQQKPEFVQKKPEEQSLNNSNGTQNQNFMKNNSSTQFSAFSQKKTPSLLSRGIFDSDSIILKRDQNSPGLRGINKDQRYVLIDSIYQVRKGTNNFKIVSPYNQCQLKCSANKILSTYYLTQGIPRQSLSQIPTKQHNIIRPLFKTTESPIQTKITLACKKCSIKSPNEAPRKVKFTFSTSVIRPRQIICDQCQTMGQWSLINLQSNYPVWSGDKKLSKKKSQKFQVIENLPELMRVMGCVDCFCYPINKKCDELICGCVVCQACHQQRLKQKRNNQCQLCES